MSNKITFYIIVICYAVISCKQEEIENLHSDYIIQPYEFCEICPDENFIELTNVDTTIYFEMGNNENLSGLGVKSAVSLTFVLSNKAVGIGSSLFRNIDSLNRTKGDNLYLIFYLSDNKPMCDPPNAWVCGSYLFDETVSAEGWYIKTSENSLGVRVEMDFFTYIDGQPVSNEFISNLSST